MVTVSLNFHDFNRMMIYIVTAALERKMPSQVMIDYLRSDENSLVYEPAFKKLTEFVSNYFDTPSLKFALFFVSLSFGRENFGTSQMSSTPSLARNFPA